jgi:hypothetical protein
MQALIDLIRLHGTKFIGWAGSTLGVLAVADASLVGGEKAIKYYLLGISLLASWRGQFTTDAFKIGLVVKQENAAKADAILKDQKQGGFATLNALLVTLVVAAVVGQLLIGCVNTQAAYKAAPLHGETLVDTAYVMAEHYDAVLVEANTLKASGRVPAPLLERMRAVDRVARPIFLGDPSKSQPGILQLRDVYVSAHDAKSEAELQRATNDAAVALANLINAVKAARGK